MANRTIWAASTFLHKCLLAVVVAVWKTWLNAWVTARTIGNLDNHGRLLSCIFECTSQEDTIEHYAVCPVVRAQWQRITGIQAYSGPLGFFMLGHEPEPLLRMRALWIYAV